MISVITPSVRPAGIEVVWKALKRQTFDDFEWIVVSPERTILDSIWVKDPPRERGDVWSLNKAYNKAISKAKGDLIVSWQDYTSAEPDALEKFWYHYSEEPKTLVSGVGNKYKDHSWAVKTWQDPRERSDFGTYYQCFFADIEFNFCAIPTEAFYSVGGFDESLDKWYGMDGYSVVDRLNIQGGWDFKLDQTNKSFSLEHGRPRNWDKKNAIGEVYNNKRKEYVANPVLEYLRR